MMRVLFHSLIVILALTSLQCTVSRKSFTFVFLGDILKHPDEFNIKEVKQYRNSILKEHYFFDKRGNFIEKIYFKDSQEVSRREQYKFDKENRLIEFLESWKGELKRKETYNFYSETKNSELANYSEHETNITFSEKNHRDKELKYIEVKNGDTLKYVQRIYDERDTLMKEIYIAEIDDEETRECIVRQYNEFGKIVTEQAYSHRYFVPQELIFDRLKAQYNPSGQLTSKIVYHKDGRKPSTERIAYYNDGTMKTKYVDHTELKEETMVYNLVRNNREQPIEGFEAILTDKLITAEIRRKYNDKGLPAEEISTECKASPVTITYKYDNQSRLIEKAIFKLRRQNIPSYKKYTYAYSGNHVTTTHYESKTSKHFYVLGKDGMQPTDTVLNLRHLKTIDTVNNLLITKKMKYNEEQYQYNSNQQIVNKLILEKDRKTQEENYIYDDAGNLLQKQIDFFLPDERVESIIKSRSSVRKRELFTYTYYPNGNKATATRQIDYFGDSEPYKEYAEFFPGYSTNSLQPYSVYTKTAYGEQTKIKTKLNAKGRSIKSKKRIKYRNQKKMSLYKTNEYTFDKNRLMTMHKIIHHNTSVPTKEWRYEYVHYE